jgi:hypothetical protein
MRKKINGKIYVKVLAWFCFIIHKSPKNMIIKEDQAGSWWCMPIILAT